MTIEIAADLVCPWCYLGLRRLQRALALHPGPRHRLIWRPFLLHPETPPEGIPFSIYLAAVAGGDPQRLIGGVLKAAMPDEALFDFSRIDTMPNSIDGHRLVRWAGRQSDGNAELQLNLVAEIFRGYFAGGLDISRHHVLVALAGQCGLNRYDAALYLDSDEDRHAVLKEHQAIRNLGIKGVPCFIIDGKYALSGAQEPEVFFPLLDLARIIEAA